MWRDAALVAGRDLRIEARSRVTVHQVAPFALLVLVLFAFALDPARSILERATPGLYWITVLFSALLALSRSAALDETAGARDALRLSGLDPSGVFVGKSLAVAAELVVLEILLGVGVIVLYGAEPAGVGLLAATCLAATVAVAATGTLYGALVSGLRVRETLLPLLLLPVLAPVLIGATRAFEAALGRAPADGWPWCGLLAAFAVLYSVAGALAYGTLLEGS
ncbi:MAG TPA: heme exporter protein CcmB [Acidimicrobiales bacterium]|nr:heme exporter protein CcmB [Acidimicrobiales bacterium]